MLPALASAGAAEPLPEVIQFNRDIRPILSDTCFKCHGPDKAKRKADLRFDTEAGAFADLGGGARAIVPHSLDKSALFQRITAKDKKQMPPLASGLKLD